MMEIVFATHNPHKVAEVNQLLPEEIRVVRLDEKGLTEDIAETEPTLEGNALLKARYVWDRLGENCFSEDTGLEVFALDMAPGVKTARYAGPQRSDRDNIQKLLSALRDQADRQARFRTVICLIIDGEPRYFEGIVNGRISTAARGEGGFGYDPVFIPEGYQQTFAQMPAAEKNTISHRGRAVMALVEFLRSKS